MTGDLIPQPSKSLARAGQIANALAAQNVLSDYLQRRAPNTLRRQAGDLARFAAFLADAGLEVGDLQHDPQAWRGVTWGMVEGFREWMLQQGDAVSSVNVRLSTVKTYAKLAMKAGAIPEADFRMIKSVTGYARKEARHIDERRPQTRRGAKKAGPVAIPDRQADALKRQPDTPQGRRDAVIMCLLLDHGLRVGELAALKVGDVDLQAGELTFYRPKVDKVQTHELTPDTRHALQAWFDYGDAPVMQDTPLLRASRKGGKLTDAGMTERAITKRVKVLGEAVGLQGLSAHDCRHYWASYWAKRLPKLPRGLFSLQEAGGWNSLAMPRRYADEAQIANEGMA